MFSPCSLVNWKQITTTSQLLCDQTRARIKRWQDNLKPLEDLFNNLCCERLSGPHAIELPVVRNLRERFLVKSTERGSSVNIYKAYGYDFQSILAEMHLIIQLSKVFNRFIGSPKPYKLFHCQWRLCVMLVGNSYSTGSVTNIAADLCKRLRIKLYS
jgi:hypothetical protein